jgi:hypothetical protein
MTVRRKDRGPDSPCFRTGGPPVARWDIDRLRRMQVTHANPEAALADPARSSAPVPRAGRPRRVLTGSMTRLAHKTHFFGSARNRRPTYLTAARFGFTVDQPHSKGYGPLR